MRKVSKPTVLPDTVGGRIAYARAEAGESQDTLSNVLGIERSFLSKIEKGKGDNARLPNIDMLKAISRRYDVTTDFLLCESDTPRGKEDQLAIQKKLGLTPEAQHYLRGYVITDVKNTRLCIDFLNTLITGWGMNELCVEISKHHELMKERLIYEELHDINIYSSIEPSPARFDGNEWVDNETPDEKAKRDSRNEAIEYYHTIYKKERASRLYIQDVFGEI